MGDSQLKTNKIVFMPKTQERFGLPGQFSTLEYPRKPQLEGRTWGEYEFAMRALSEMGTFRRARSQEDQMIALRRLHKLFAFALKVKPGFSPNAIDPFQEALLEFTAQAAIQGMSYEDLMRSVLTMEKQLKDAFDPQPPEEWWQTGWEGRDTYKLTSFFEAAKGDRSIIGVRAAIVDGIMMTIRTDDFHSQCSHGSTYMARWGWSGAHNYRAGRNRSKFGVTVDFGSGDEALRVFLPAQLDHEMDPVGQSVVIPTKRINRGQRREHVPWQWYMPDDGYKCDEALPVDALNFLRKRVDLPLINHALRSGLEKEPSVQLVTESDLAQ